MKILVLTGKFGMGHYSTAKSLEQEIRKEMKDSEIEIIDILDYLTPKLNTFIYSGFNLLVEKASGFYNMVYNNMDNFPIDLDKNLWTIFYSKIDRLLARGGYDIIISTLPLSSTIISEYKKSRKNNIPLITYITDISVHSEWISEKTDVYMVATKGVKEKLMEAGIAGERIIVRGIPVKEEFMNNRLKNRSLSKKKVLIMGGGLGLIPIREAEFRKLNDNKNIEVTIITGKNKKIYNKLKSSYANFKVIGYTDRVWEYMQNADLIVSKSGGITLFESIYSELPMIVLNPFLAQEINNAKFIEREKIGRVQWKKSDDIYNMIEAVLWEDLKMESMRKNMNFIKKSRNQESIRNILMGIEGEIKVS